MIPTGAQTIHKAEGESVTLGCRYTLSPLDIGDLDIEWSVVSPDTTQKNQMVRSRMQRDVAVFIYLFWGAKQRAI